MRSSLAVIVEVPREVVEKAYTYREVERYLDGALRDAKWRTKARLQEFYAEVKSDGSVSGDGAADRDGVGS